MTFRAAWLLVVLTGTAGCQAYPQRQCNEHDPPESCCPPGSHKVASDFIPDYVVCVLDEDAGAGDGVGDDGGTDAH